MKKTLIILMWIINAVNAISAAFKHGLSSSEYKYASLVLIAISIAILIYDKLDSLEKRID